MDDTNQGARRSAIRWLEAACVLTVVTVLGFLTWATAVTRYGKYCTPNLKQVGLGMMQYLRDYDEKMPPRSKATQWPQVVNPYVKNEQLFDCPAPYASYALHAKLGGITMVRVTEPSQMPMIFDSTLNTLDAWDDGASWPTHGLHRQTVFGQDGANTLFFDGRVKWSRSKPDFQSKIAP
jgi:prepilin-type processing-associated H-X9-DG protein